MQVAYIFVLKEIVLLDVFVLALGFVMRAISGAVVIARRDLPVALYRDPARRSLFLGLTKRRSELVLLEGERRNTERFSRCTRRRCSTA